MALHLVGIIPVPLTGTVWLVIHDVFYKCQYSGNIGSGSKGRTYRLPQTQACSTLRSQVNKL